MLRSHPMRFEFQPERVRRTQGAASFPCMKTLGSKEQFTELNEAPNEHVGRNFCCQNILSVVVAKNEMSLERDVQTVSVEHRTCGAEHVRGHVFMFDLQRCACALPERTN